MITGIGKIKGLGVYQNYTKPAGTQNFASKNLIYGWNYSGKTTLSRLFAQLESKTSNPDLNGCEFSFETTDQKINEKNFQQCELTVRVFNSDFIRENIHFEGGGFNPILILGKDSEEAEKKIEKLNARLERSTATQNIINSKFDALKAEIARAKTSAAENIRQVLKVSPYDARHLGNDVGIVGVLESQILSDEDLACNLELAVTPASRKPSTVEQVFGRPSIEALYNEASNALAATPSFSNTIKHLEDNPAIERWVENGLHIHPAAGACEFCGNEVAQARLETFRAHFSKDLADHKNSVEALLSKTHANEFTLMLPNEAQFNHQYRDAYRNAAEPLPHAIKCFNRAVNKLAKDIKSKIENLHKSLVPAVLAPGLAENITKAILEVNAVIKSNNELAENFTKAKAEAHQKVKNHYVQQFIDKQETFGLDRKKDRQVKRSERLKAYSKHLQLLIKELQALISHAQRGREKINDRLASMLGNTAVQINVVTDAAGQERFQLVRRNGHIAKNLSDGERTAIAFSYFIIKLQELSPEIFKGSVVYIDDPISSLDGNHIYQITSAINEIFFHKIQNTQGSETWTTTCKQLFISTHSFEFFNLLRELKPDGGNHARLYLVHRINDDCSSLGNMPKSLSSYGSEYHFLFEKIYRFHETEDKVNIELLMLPNAVRRFVELYTYSRIPSTQRETVDQRASELFGKEKSKSILKLLHTFSHGNTIDRLAGNNELIFLLEQTVKDLFEEIQNSDQRHWSALIKSLP
ncbi:AAA family ATPase [Pseudomonas viridiflava]|uniref:AAA family ATPase n=1 Tax=Pseudomonas viridiflava TaxID=33069 RepID=UPI002EA57D29|nr:AAA family ATPase [Pseudomonas viridiflava]